MGVLEGYYTANLLDAAFANYNASAGFMKDGHLPDVLQKFIDKQTSWMQDQVASHGPGTNSTLYEYWQQVNMLVAHLQGLYDGYVKSSSAPIKLDRNQVSGLSDSIR